MFSSFSVIRESSFLLDFTNRFIYMKFWKWFFIILLKIKAVTNFGQDVNIIVNHAVNHNITYLHHGLKVLHLHTVFCETCVQSRLFLKYCIEWVKNINCIFCYWFLIYLNTISLPRIVTKFAQKSSISMYVNASAQKCDMEHFIPIMLHTFHDAIRKNSILC